MLIYLNEDVPSQDVKYQIVNEFKTILTTTSMTVFEKFKNKDKITKEMFLEFMDLKRKKMNF